MKGCIIERNSSLRLMVSLGKNPQTGKYDYYSETFHGTKTEAQKRLRQILTDLDKGIFAKPGKLTVAEYLRSWMKDYAYTNLSPETAKNYDSIISSHFIPFLGNTTLSQLKPNMIQQYISNKLSKGRSDGKGGLSSTTVRHHIVCLHTALQHAVKMGILFNNPVDAVNIPRPERHDMNTMTESDIHLFLELARPTQYHALFYTALFTGMRRSELLALRWQDVDLLLLQVSVCRSLHQLKGGKIVFKQPKTERSRRLVALTPSTATVLKEHLNSQNTLRESLGYDKFSDDDLIFCQYNGKPLLPNTVTHNWIKLARRAGLSNIRLHDARHTHASLMLKQGVHPKIVQERLGHSSIQITLDTYSHITPSMQQNAANTFDNIVMPQQELSKVN